MSEKAVLIDGMPWMEVMENVHDPSKCEGQGCPIHHPSDHHMKDWPLHWRGDRGIFERICPHDVGHPDPDTMDFLERRIPAEAEAIGVHGCDGCCARSTCPTCGGKDRDGGSVVIAGPDENGQYDTDDCPDEFHS